MKRLLLCVALACIALTSNATNYYFSTSAGDDSRSTQEAQNPATPWKSLSKLNNFFSQLQPGDSVLFKRGEIFYGSFNVTKSGSQGAPIVISAYGNGARPVFTGFTSVAGWSSVGNNIYSADCSSCSAGLNTVVIDNSLKPLGRYPNSDAPNGGHLVIQSHNGRSSVTSNELNSSANWTGAQIVIRKNEWILDKGTITGQSGSTLSYDNPTSYEPLDYYGYFIQNDARTLDQEGEWFYDANNHKLLMYTGGNPASKNVQASTINVIVNLSAHDYITLDNIQIVGGNTNAMYVEYANHITVQNSDIVFSGGYAIKGFILNYFTLQNSNINHSFSNGIYVAPFCSNTVIRKNKIHNIGLAPGMGGSNNQTYEGIVVHGSNNLIELNRLDSIGYIAIRFFGDDALIRHNFVNNFALTKDDGGGIYTNGDNVFHNQRVLNNVIMNGKGAPHGTNSTVPTAASGIYMDDRSANVEISGNSIANCSENGIFLHNAHEIIVRNNTLYNNKIQSGMVHDVLEPHDPIRNVEMMKNILFSKGSTQVISNLESTLNDIGQFGNFDSNYYCRPINEGLVVNTKAVGVEQTYNLEGWRNTFNKDHNARTTPMEIPAFSYKVTGNNLFANGSFNSNVNGVSAFAIPANLSTTWANDGKLDGGSLKASYNTSNGNVTSGDVIFNIGAITAGKTYVVSFSMLGINNDADLSVFLRNNTGSYNNLAEINNFKNTNTRSEQEFLFHATASCNTATLVFKIDGGDCPVYIDNLELYEATVKMNSADSYVRFEYNETDAPKTIALDGNYIDVAQNQFANSITLEPFSSAVLLKESLSSLPLKFVEFKGKKNNQNVDLTWITANEVNTSHFEIERSSNGSDYSKIGTVSSTNIATGTSTYKFTDFTPSAQNNYYRLKQFDKDGKSTYSNIVMISNAGEVKMTVSPNPATEKIRVAVSTPQANQKASISIHALSGVTVKTMTATLSADGVNIDVTSLPSGIYVVHVAGDGINFNERFVKQ